jgi:hypothetical protein
MIFAISNDWQLETIDGEAFTLTDPARDNLPDALSNSALAIDAIVQRGLLSWTEAKRFLRRITQLIAKQQKYQQGNHLDVSIPH